jgi:hypothetical protein
MEKKYTHKELNPRPPKRSVWGHSWCALPTYQVRHLTNYTTGPTKDDQIKSITQLLSPLQFNCGTQSVKPTIQLSTFNLEVTLTTTRHAPDAALHPITRINPSTCRAIPALLYRPAYSHAQGTHMALTVPSRISRTVPTHPSSVRPRRHNALHGVFLRPDRGCYLAAVRMARRRPRGL